MAANVRMNYASASQISLVTIVIFRFSNPRRALTSIGFADDKYNCFRFPKPASGVTSVTRVPDKYKK